MDDARRGKRGDLRQTDGIAKQFRATIVDGLTQQLDDDLPLVLCGPGQNRDRMLADLKAAGHQRQMLSVGTTIGGRAAANEVLREGLAGDLLAQHRMVQEIGLLEEAWKRISTNGAVAYGQAAIERATEGAVETLLIGADVLRDRRTSCERKSWTAIAEQVETVLRQRRPVLD